MKQIFKRLEIIKSSLEIEDEEIIELQILKLKDLDIDDIIKDIISRLERLEYNSVITDIQNYLVKYNGMVEYIDSELAELKLELKASETTLQKLSEQKIEYLNEIDEFNTEYHLQLGAIIENILNLKKEILYKKTIKQQKIKEQYREDLETYEDTRATIEELHSTISELKEALDNIDETHDQYDEIKDAYDELQEELEKLEEDIKEQKQKLDDTDETIKIDDDVFEEYEDIKSNYEEFNHEYENLKKEDEKNIKLSHSDKKELKKLYKKAARLCPPDIVTDTLKEKAHEIMQALNDAYSKKDINQVKQILLSLENGTSFELSSDNINDKELLKSKLKEYKQTITELKNDIEEIKSDDTFITISSLDDWDKYFEELKNELLKEQEILEIEARKVLREKYKAEKNLIKRDKDFTNKNNRKIIKEKKGSFLSSIGESITNSIDTFNGGIQTCRETLELTRNALQDAIEQSKLDLVNTKKKAVIQYLDLGFSIEDISKELDWEIDIIQNIIKEQTINSESYISTIKYLSTSAIARRHNIQAKPNLFDKLLELNLLYKDDKAYRLTSEGKKTGGKYRNNEKGEEWVVWEENSLNEIIEDLKVKPVLRDNEIQTLTTHQNQIYDKVTTNIEDIFNGLFIGENRISISGSAGVGKTFLIIKIIQYLKQNEFSLIVTTPTHKSLSVIRNNLHKYNIDDIPTKTLHSFLQLKLEIDERTGSKVFVVDDKNKEENTTEVLIVDESSMIGNDLFNFINQSIEEGRIKAVIFVGDPYQLPPVNSEKNTIFKLKNSYLLEEIIRQQKDSYIIDIATRIRDCIINQDFSLDIEDFFQKNLKELKIFTNEDNFLNLFFRNDSEYWYSKDQIIADYTNKSVDRYNHIVRERYWSDRGISNPNQIEIDDIVVFQEAVLKGEKVIYQNGSITKVKKVSQGYDKELELSFWLCVDEYEREFKVVNHLNNNKYQHMLENKIKEAKSAKAGYEKKLKWIEYYKFKEKYASIKFNYSSTIHKLQGSTYDTVFIDIRKMQNLYKYSNNIEKEFLFRLLYVAVTRASKNINLLMTINN
ncbi:AAA family ATPase [Arcobacter peruensis]|uniref:AAA family ATPase n=1 Tax=Arcobacter peruensis TaxID=2320140 RepID=UPI000F0811E3|nr:AAA family ATPase [Arcobacter peruensis]